MCVWQRLLDPSSAGMQARRQAEQATGHPRRFPCATDFKGHVEPSRVGPSLLEWRASGSPIGDRMPTHPRMVRYDCSAATNSPPYNYSTSCISCDEDARLHLLAVGGLAAPMTGRQGRLLHQGSSSARLLKSIRACFFGYIPEHVTSAAHKMMYDTP